MKTMILTCTAAILFILAVNVLSLTYGISFNVNVSFNPPSYMDALAISAHKHITHPIGIQDLPIDAWFRIDLGIEVQQAIAGVR